MMGFAFNLIFNTSSNANVTDGLILGAPCVPALALLAALWYCPESPRYYLRRDSPNFSPARALDVLLRIRSTEVCPVPFAN